MNFDEKTRIYFDKRVKQVFVYLTSFCQLRCKQCLYKPLLRDTPQCVRYPVLLELLERFHQFGAYKLSFLGGEPTLYYDSDDQKNFGDVVKAAKQIGYRYVRVDTNGQFAHNFLDNENINLLDEITFSLDGHDKQTNDIVRGAGSYRKCVENIQYAISKGFNVQITSCVHKYSCPDARAGLFNLKNMIMFAQKLGVHSINFHPILKVGIARDTWIEDTDILPETWEAIYQSLIGEILGQQYRIKVRIPMRFAKKEDVTKARENYLYCPLEMGERALIMPDGQIKVCAFTIGTDECVARYDGTNVTFEKERNETVHIGSSLETTAVCYNQIIPEEKLIPLCMSFKPYQSEIVWEQLRNG